MASCGWVLCSVCWLLMVVVCCLVTLRLRRAVLSVTLDIVLPAASWDVSSFVDGAGIQRSEQSTEGWWCWQRRMMAKIREAQRNNDNNTIIRGEEITYVHIDNQRIEL